MPRHFPPELFAEIIGYLWNDIPSLKACSLAHPGMTVPSQKRLFYSIGLRSPRKRRKYIKLVENETTGTSYDFWRLLVRSPHIARYVRSLFILDYSICGPDVVAMVQDDQTDSSGLLHEGGEYVVFKPPQRCYVAGFYGWLVNDRYLPRYAPLLDNLKAFTFDYFDGWPFLPSEIYAALLRLMRLPSLLYVRILREYPSALFNVAIGDNVKHLALRRFRPESAQLSVLPRCPSSGPLYINSLSIEEASGFVDSHLKDPDCRISISSLQKLTVIAGRHSEHAAVSTILQTCRETLEDFEFTPSLEVRSSRYNLTNVFDDPIDLSKLTSLKRFAVHLYLKRFDAINDVMAISTNFPWFNGILLSMDPLPVSQQLEEISILLFYSDPAGNILLYLKDTFDILLDNRFKTLKRLNVSISSSAEIVHYVVDVLNISGHVAKLRQGGVIVDVRACNRSLHFQVEPDVRWKTCSWKTWNHIDVHEDCWEPLTRW